MEEKNLVHNVFFTLKKTSNAIVQKFIESCYFYLKDQPGILYFSAGSLVRELNFDVSVKDFHVGLHIIFANKSYHDQYQEAEKHIIFIDRNKDNWNQVRVFDTYVD